MAADYNIRDEWDNGEFLTGCTMDLILDGEVVETHEFVGSSEFADNDGSAIRQAISFGVAWIESQEYTLEERLGPFGLEWEREQAERYPEPVWLAQDEVLVGIGDFDGGDLPF